MAQALIDFDTADLESGLRPEPPAPTRASVPAADCADSGYRIGWDHARHGLVPPAAHLHAGNPLRTGWEAGKVSFGRRTLAPTPRVRQWLQLRLDAWLRGIAFETLQVTPHYLGQIEVRSCPVTRREMGGGAASGDARDGGSRVERIRSDAGFAAGNLAMLAATAATAADWVGHDWREALRQAERLDATPAAAGPAARDGLDPLDTLDAAAWRRLAVLLSFTTPLAHDEAAQLPLHLLPPNRVRLLNPLQGLQVLLSLRLATVGGMAAIRSLAERMPGEAPRAAFSRFVAALLPRLLEADCGSAGRPAPEACGADRAARRRTAIEDAWSHPLVQSRWQRFALALTEAQAQAMLKHAGVWVPAGQRVQWMDSEQATEGWALASAGRTPQDGAAERWPAAPAPARSPRMPAAERGAAAPMPATLQ